MSRTLSQIFLDNQIDQKFCWFSRMDVGHHTSLQSRSFMLNDMSHIMDLGFIILKTECSQTWQKKHIWLLESHKLVLISFSRQTTTTTTKKKTSSLETVSTGQSFTFFGKRRHTLRWFFSFLVGFCPPARARCVAPPPKPRWPPSMEMKYSQPPRRIWQLVRCKLTLGPRNLSWSVQM